MKSIKKGLKWGYTKDQLTLWAKEVVADRDSNELFAHAEDWETCAEFCIFGEPEPLPTLKELAEAFAQQAYHERAKRGLPASRAEAIQLLKNRQAAADQAPDQAHLQEKVREAEGFLNCY